MSKKKVVIVGGGFGGIKTALTLAAQNRDDVHITLISDKPHFEYHALLYRVLTGRSPLEVCIPLRDIFAGTTVDVVEDTVTDVSLQNAIVEGSSGSQYHYDYLVLALGSEVEYFNTPGLRDNSFSINTIASTLKLKRHLHEVFLQCQNASAEDKVCRTCIVVVGGGATGVETAGELAVYVRELAARHGVDPSYITIDLIHSGARLLPALSAEESEFIRRRLNRLGVNVLLNRRVIKEEIDAVYLKDMQMRTNTLIWSAGVTLNSLYGKIAGLQVNDKKKIVVDDNLRAQGMQNVYVVGDAAATPTSGFASSAVHDGVYVGHHIAAQLQNVTTEKYVPKKSMVLVPVGPNWAIGRVGEMIIHGRLGWFLRRYLDLRFFFSILPPRKAWLAFRSDAVLWEICPLCSSAHAVQ